MVRIFPAHWRPNETGLLNSCQRLNWRGPAGGRSGVCLLRPENRTRAPVDTSPVLHPGSGGSQGGLGREVCGCSAAGGTRLGCVRGTLGAICFIARLPPWSPYCALPPGPRSPSMLHPYLSRRAPLPYLGSGPWRLLRIQVCVRALLARWSGARLCSGEVGPGGSSGMVTGVEFLQAIPPPYPTW